MGETENTNPQPSADATQPVSSVPQVLLARARDFVDRGSQKTGLEKAVFVPLTGGAAALALLLLTTLFSWYGSFTSGKVMGQQINEGAWWRGITYTEGKWVLTFALAAIVWLALGIMKRSWLPAGILAAGGVGVFSMVVMYVLRHRMLRDFNNGKAELDRVREMVGSSVLAQFASDQTGNTIPTLSGGPSWALGFGILLSIGIAGLFLLLSLTNPPTLPYFQKPGMPPFVQRYGFVASGYGAALFFGIIFAVMCYQ